MNGVLQISLPTMDRDGVALRSFLAGIENRLAGVAVAATIAEPHSPYNPLVLHGPSGAGKSHLARGLGLEFQRTRPLARVVYVSGSDFARDFADALEQRSIESFRHGYHTASMLVLDGLEGLTGKAAAQRELAQTLDILLDQEARIVVTAAQAPALQMSLLPRLRSRLSAGLCVPLALPGPAARQALLEYYAQVRCLELPRSVIRILAEGLPQSAPELHGSLVALTMRDGDPPGGQVKTPIDTAAARRFVAERRSTPQVGLPRIAGQTARYFGLTMADLRGPSRRRGIVLARGVAMHLARQLTANSLEQIGRYFGGRDHSTVLHGCRQMDRLVDRDPAASQAVTTLRRKLSSANSARA